MWDYDDLLLFVLKANSRMSSIQPSHLPYTQLLHPLTPSICRTNDPRTQPRLAHSVHRQCGNHLVVLAFIHFLSFPSVLDGLFVSVKPLLILPCLLHAL